MNILITNDDGIYAQGIYKLACALDNIANIYVVAPDRQRSATGHAITMHEPLRAEKIKFFDKDFQAWAISGTPTDCVKLAIEALIPEKINIVFSGINKGPNLGTDVLYSGTVSAAIEGAILGYPAVAVSLADFKDVDYNYAAEFCMSLAKKILDNPLPEDTLLNVNIPNCKKETLKGVNITTLGVRKYKNSFIERIDPRGQSYYWLGGEIMDEKNHEGTDIHSIKNDAISITPIHFDLTKFDLIEQVKKWNIEIN
ncbi:5'/3'-nucleotidase SurE [Marinisporobacter balticus]|uniref:5'-nucleotidase SurE n=1 Tax=Marinisporobacter balticus TaxID=2018667 RepID=A0A4R2L3J5_9FIRM|nr:5'/3'-nucleotidase SurE [Marinisporobacter balticus]TCO79797.1 5'-nucleotidase /3'-nucleotidase /exopolyphosphatase [Marinisporobacter balticus]